MEVDVTEPGKIVLNKGYLTTGVWGDTEALPSMHQRMQKGGCVLNRYWDGETMLNITQANCASFQTLKLTLQIIKISKSRIS